MESLSVVLLVLCSIFTGAALSSLLDFYLSKKKGSAKRSAVRLSLFFLFTSCVIVCISCLLIFTTILADIISFGPADYMYYAVFIAAGFFSSLWYKTFLPLCASVYIIVFLSFMYYLDASFLSYEAPVTITFEENSVHEGERLLPLISSENGTQQNFQKSGYLAVQEYEIPVKIILPVQRHYYRLIFFSQDRILQDDFAQDFFSPADVPGKSVFFYGVARVLESIYTLLSEPVQGNNPVFYFIEVTSSGFYPYVYTLQPVKKGEGFSYIFDKLL